VAFGFLRTDRTLSLFLGEKILDKSTPDVPGDLVLAGLVAVVSNGEDVSMVRWISPLFFLSNYGGDDSIIKVFLPFKSLILTSFFF
jgi:hypothetical protein